MITKERVQQFQTRILKECGTGAEVTTVLHEMLEEAVEEVVFNINHRVMVKITPAGYAHLQKRDDEMRAQFPGVGVKWDEAVRRKRYADDHDGWTEWQMHDLMHTFGSVTTMGADVPFETEIILMPGSC